MKKGQSNRLTEQQKEGQGPITIFHKDAQIHDKEVGNTSFFVIKQLEYEFPMLKFRYRKEERFVVDDRITDELQIEKIEVGTISLVAVFDGKEIDNTWIGT